METPNTEVCRLNPHEDDTRSLHKFRSIFLHNLQLHQKTSSPPSSILPCTHAHTSPWPVSYQALLILLPVQKSPPSYAHGSLSDLAIISHLDYPNMPFIALQSISHTAARATFQTNRSIPKLTK